MNALLICLLYCDAGTGCLIRTVCKYSILIRPRDWSSYVSLLRSFSFTSRKLYVCLERFLCFLQLSNRAFVSQVRFILPCGRSDTT